VTLRVDPRHRFSATVDLYARYRPSYPPELLDWLIQVAALGPGARVADLGCGTGISTRLLAARGLDVVGVDPNEAMLAEARRQGGGARYQRGEAAATGLPDGSMSLVVAGQAFHWFDLAATQRELARVLVPGGRAAAFWNTRAHTPAMDEYEALLLGYSKEYAQLRSPEQTIASIRAFPSAASLVEASFQGSQSFDREAFHGRVYSSSYVVHGVDQRAEFDRDLEALFDRHAVEGQLEFRYLVIAIAWRVGPSGP
jgi:SAM-dependent methyltransferase